MEEIYYSYVWYSNTQQTKSTQGIKTGQNIIVVEINFVTMVDVDDIRRSDKWSCITKNVICCKKKMYHDTLTSWIHIFSYLLHRLLNDTILVTDHPQTELSKNTEVGLVGKWLQLWQFSTLEAEIGM